MTANDLMALLGKKEELHPDLESWMQEGGILTLLNHPLVQEFVHDRSRCALINERYRVKLAARAKALEDGNIHSYIFLHERPYRLQALIDYAKYKTVSGEDFWSAVGSIWVDSENIWQNKRMWVLIWSGLIHNDTHKHRAMDEQELDKYLQLKAPFKVYRGINGEKADEKGLSWTLDKDKAAWFANRFRSKTDKGILVTATIQDVSHVDAVFLGRGESEIVTRKPMKLKYKTI